MKESKNVELKGEITPRFLKTVSVFANYGDGEIIFGVDDKGIVVGLKDLNETALQIENSINDSIKPRPEFYFEKNYKNKTLKLIVKEGLSKPYLYKGKAYKRFDTSSVEVDQIELKRLIMQGMNLYFDQLESKEKDLSFGFLAQKLKEILNIDLDFNILRTLNLYDGQKFNIAAELFADKNNFPGIDIARFKDGINIFLERKNIKNKSILEVFDECMDVFKRNYIYEEVTEGTRKKIEAIPEKAFKEAIANALVHRTWDVNSSIRVAMYNDRIEIFSPGGLCNGIRKDEFLNGQVSQFRNPTIGYIFYRLNYIEMFGTGIKRILDEYSSREAKPIFDVYPNSIKITLPSIEQKVAISKDEKKILDYLKQGIQASSSNIVEDVGFKKDKSIRLLNSLLNKNYIRVTGNGRGTKYFI